MENIIETLIKKIKNNEIEKEELIRYLQKVSWRIESLEDMLERMEKIYKEKYKQNEEIADFAEELAYNNAKEYTLNVFYKMEVE